jgi:spore maturation protein CgeB
MNIAFFGSSLVSAYWNGAATYYRGMLKALAALGHRITFYEPDAFARQQHRDIDEPDWARVVVYPATADGWESALARAARDCDLLVKASGVGVFDAELESAVPLLRRGQSMIVYWDVDAPATLETIEQDPSHHLRKAIPLYDLVLTYGGGDPVVNAYRRVGAKLCVPIYNALDSATHFPVAPRDRFASDLGFLGNRLPDREQRVDEFFLKAASMLPGRSFLLGGAGWEDKTVPRNVRKAGHVGTGDHNAFFSSSLAALNVNRASMARYGFSPPTRIFEAAGAGACLISDAWAGLEQFLEPGEEVLVANNGDEVAELLGKLDRDQAERVARAARKRVLSHHTYVHRARQVNDVLNASLLQSEAAA